MFLQCRLFAATMYNGEKTLMKEKLEFLSKYCEKIVITEGDKTQAGDDKEYLFLKDFDKEFIDSHKVLYKQIKLKGKNNLYDEGKEIDKNIANIQMKGMLKDLALANEAYLRDVAYNILFEETDINQEDYVFVSDCDEVITNDTLSLIFKLDIDICKIEMDEYWYDRKHKTNKIHRFMFLGKFKCLSGAKLTRIRNAVNDIYTVQGDKFIGHHYSNFVEDLPFEDKIKFLMRKFSGCYDYRELGNDKNDLKNRILHDITNKNDEYISAINPEVKIKTLKLAC